ncbi:MAG: O-antigen ligase family protein [Phycisphaerales bacterium]|nr:O-antigen ligase family protein [Phycisphaerales bacterium]
MSIESVNRVGNSVSRCALALWIALVVGTFLLISPPGEQTFPGQVPWSDGSVLRVVIQAMSLGGSISTARGVEIKALVFHVAAVAGLMLLAVAVLRGVVRGIRARDAGGVWLGGQALLLGWVAMSIASALWAGDPGIAIGQAAIYALSVAWTLALAWTLDARHVRAALDSLVVVSVVGAVLCLWFYFERNPHHRPGFPIGNPSTIAACILPATLISIMGFLSGVRLRGPVSRETRTAALAYGAALIPLLLCLYVTFSRGAVLGLAAGLSVAGFIAAGPRLRRWLVPACVLILATGAWWLYQWSLVAGFGRGGSMRFRFYAWQYAAELWWLRPFSGHGAGAFTRMAGGELSQRDRLLDPAAFAGDWLDHAHNEVFEVLAEIGLVGGVTYVGALIALLITGAHLYRAHCPAIPRWMRLGLAAAVAALVADALVGVGMRLEGVQAVFYCIAGVLLAALRGAAPSESDQSPGDTLATLRGVAAESRSASLLRRSALALVVTLGAVGCATAAMTNWFGVLAEAQIAAAMREGRNQDAIRLGLVAERTLLTPFRKLAAAERVMEARFEAARLAAVKLLEETRGGADAAQRDVEAVAKLGRDAYEAARLLDARATGFGRVQAIQAYASEMLSTLYQERDANLAAEWRRRAHTAWLVQRRRAPVDREALLALLRYPAPIAESSTYLRDALRGGWADENWRAALTAHLRTGGLEAVVSGMLAEAEPLDARSDLDSLVLSMAPESYRLAAAVAALRQEYDVAAGYAERAAELYQPLIPRLPELHSIALGEQAEYVLRADPRNAAAAMNLIRDAIARLPVISGEKFDALAAPLRLRAVPALLACDRVQEAEDVLRRVLGPGTDSRAALAGSYADLVRLFAKRGDLPPQLVDGWIDAVLRIDPTHMTAWSWRAWRVAKSGDAGAVREVLSKAAEAGVSEANRNRIRDALCQEFPAVCDQLR